MKQRLVGLAKTELKGEGAGVYRVKVLALPGYYLLFVGMWV